MNRTVPFLFCLLFLGWAVSAQGAEPSAAYEHLKPLEWEIGDWVSEYQSAADSGPIKKGDTVTVHFSIRWSPDRSFFVNNSSSEVNGKKVATALEIISWDYEKSVVRHAYYGTWGTGQGIWTKVGDRPEIEWTIQGPYGTFQGKSYSTRGADSWEWQIKDQTRNGEKMTDMPLATFRRKTGVPPGELWQAYREAAVGAWSGEGVIPGDFGSLPIAKGDRFAMQFTLKPDLDGKVAVGETDFHLVNKTFTSKCRVLAGWDPDTQQVRFTALWSGDLVEEIVITGKKGSSFLGTYTAKLPGTATSRSRISIDFPDKDHYAIKFLDGPYKGETISSFTRVQSR